MPLYRQMDDGRVAAVRMTNFPRRGVGCAGPGCRGVGAAPGPAQLSPAARAALAIGAVTGPRAARYAVQAVHSRGLGGLGEWIWDPGAGKYYDSQTGIYEGESDVRGDSGSPSSWSMPTTQDVRDVTALLGNIAGQGINAYGQFTGGAKPPPSAASSGPSTGLILGVLGVLGAIVVVVGGVAIAVSASRKAA